MSFIERRSAAALALSALALLPNGVAQPASPPGTPPVVNVQSPPGTAGVAPFMRAPFDPNPIPVTGTATQVDIYQPLGTTSYRLTNPCGIDIAIKTVPDRSTTVTPSTGTWVLARTTETLASTQNPLGTTSTDRIVSIIGISTVTHQPASDPGGPCTVYLAYGNGG